MAQERSAFLRSHFPRYIFQKPRSFSNPWQVIETIQSPITRVDRYQEFLTYAQQARSSNVRSTMNAKWRCILKPDAAFVAKSKVAFARERLWLRAKPHRVEARGSGRHPRQIGIFGARTVLVRSHIAVLAQENDLDNCADESYKRDHANQHENQKQPAAPAGVVEAAHTHGQPWNHGCQRVDPHGNEQNAPVIMRNDESNDPDHS